MDGGAYNPRTVEEVFRDFKGRRAAMIKALTTGIYLFFVFEKRKKIPNFLLMGLFTSSFFKFFAFFVFSL